MNEYIVKLTLPVDWVVSVKAETEEEAIKKALAKPCPEKPVPVAGAWSLEIAEWPYVQGMSIEAELDN